MLALLLILSSVFAVQNLPCNRALESLHAENEIVMRGTLDPFWETGMEDQTGWSIVDDETRRWLSRDPWDSQFFLREGDYVTVTIAGVIYRGYYRETRTKRSFVFNGRVVTAYPNIPRLTDAQGGDVLDPEHFQRAFLEAYPAEVVRKLSALELETLDAQHRRWRALHDHFRDKRQVDVGGGQIHEAAYFATIGRGELFESGGRIKLRVPKGETDFYPNDTLYVNDGSLTHKFEIKSFPWSGDEEVRRLMSRPHKATVIR